MQTNWPPIGRLYSTYWAEWLGGTPPAAGSRDPLPGLVLPALGMSLGLLLIAFVVSTALGLLLGVGATRAASPSALPGVRAAPLWKVALGEAKTPVGGTVAAGRIYVATAEGELIALADPNP